MRQLVLAKQRNEHALQETEEVTRNRREMIMAKSDWLGKNKPCSTCKGSGNSSKNAKGETIPCPTCGGFGF